jgi:hypothetical protein
MSTSWLMLKKNIERKLLKAHLVDLVPKFASNSIIMQAQKTFDEGTSSAELTVDLDLPGVRHRLGTEEVANEDELTRDGRVNEELLHINNVLKTAVAGKQLAHNISRHMSPCETLVDDPRFNEVQQSLGWTCLAVAGIVTPANKYTNATKFAQFAAAFERYEEEGDEMEAEERALLNFLTTEVKEYVLSHTSVLVSTATNAASGIIVKVYIPDSLTLDEGSQLNLGDFMIGAAHSKTKFVFIYGDSKQLEPAVNGPNPLEGFLQDLTVSGISFFSNARWPSAVLYLNRRSRG